MEASFSSLIFRSLPHFSISPFPIPVSLRASFLFLFSFFYSLA